MNSYKVLNKQIFENGKHSIIPIRIQDRYKIMKWRNEQIYHLRQSKPLIKEDQDNYFNTIIAQLFDNEKPEQILFSYLEEGKCIGYGGLVRINWIDKNAEISFVMDTSLEKEYFGFHWSKFLRLIENLAFEELELHKIYTYAYDLRIKIFKTLEKNHFKKEAVLKEHLQINNSFYDIIIHSKINN
jgi:RimJ/RimL family protein N-acetyltransferase